MKTTSLKRRALTAGVVLGAMGATLLAPSIAQAEVPNPLPAGINLGGLHLTPTSGDAGVTPSFTAASACPAGTNLANVNTIDLGGVEQTISTNVAGVIAVTPGFGAAFNTDMGTVQALAGNGGQESFLFLVDCRTGAGHGTYTDAVQVDYAADGSWQVHGSGPVQQQTTTTVSPATQTVAPGTNVTVTASVSPAAATGTVEFKEGATTLFTTPSGSGTFTYSTTGLAVGSHSITATFHAADTAAYSNSTSSVATVVIASNTLTATENIQVGVPQEQGVFTLTVDPGLVDMGTAHLTGTGDARHFHAEGNLKNVNISDGRDQTVPGWSVTGQVGDFTNTADATKKFSGSSLGWQPAVVANNAAANVSAGPAVNTGSTPGLTSATTLGGAQAGKGLGDSKLGAALSLDFPKGTTPGTYAATITITGLGGTPLA
ncbi:Ig-like domain-containing protein [Dactylosporangium sp. NPDC049140]|uniref:Ig-like domain-containing protein n=1 Tax=Dactylosporangium sp. NPDC049140 TaxID=3155647 RepID=UPI0033D29C63